ncbi:MAG: cyclic nucleotide-binding domain-containing protein [Betaproteobacteria bacterium]|nr:cyclic nucleotide-binding domain-containing protein [Betaproteobacteria bacterium]
MKTSIIRYRVADFLKQSAPFDAISEEDLLELAATGRVSFHEAGEFIFRRNAPRKPCLWVVQQGTVEIVDETEEGDRLYDLLGAGDVLGLAYFLGRESYLHSAKTSSDVILYSIDARSFAVHVTKYPRVARFLAARFSISGLYQNVLQATVDEKLRGATLQSASWLDTAGPSPEFLRARLRVCTPGQPARDAARAMATCPGDAIAVLDDNGTAVGVITARDLHERMASAAGTAGDTCESVMTTRFATTAPNLTSEAYLLQMMRSRTPLLVVTLDGTRASRAEGLLSARELSCVTGRNLPLLAAELAHARTVAEWRLLVAQARALAAEALTGPATFARVAEIVSLFDAALVESIVCAVREELPAGDAGVAAVPHCWLLFGKAGRAEIIEPVQPEIGIVYADPPHEQEARVAQYFRTILERVSLHLTACGLDRPLPAAAEKDILRCRSLSDWKQFFDAMIGNPIENEVYATRRFLDYRVLCGDPDLERELTAAIGANLRASRSFIPILANDTLERLPPMTFFHGLVIELDGAQTQDLDLGATALSPITDAARVYALAAGSLDAKSTLQRLDVAAAAVPEAATVFHEAAGAFRAASCYAAAAAMKSTTRSPLIAASQLPKYDQRLLKTAFESVQKLIEFTSTPAQWIRRM